MTYLKKAGRLLLGLPLLLVKSVFWGLVYLVGAILNTIPPFWEALGEASALFIKVSLAILLGSLLVGSGLKLLDYAIDAQKVDEQLPPLKMSDTVKNDEQIYNPMIRLTRNGKFHCSGSAISDTYAITAAHCVQGVGGAMNTASIDIQDADSKETRTKARAVGMLKSQDVALLMGDFKKFRKIPMETDPRGWLAHRGPYISCGFPGGDKAICTPFMPQGNNQFLIYGNGFLYKGMSGGPVFDSQTGQLIAVNSRVNNQGASVGPLIGFLAVMGVEIQE